ncbi:Ras-associating and dilute domain-containing protein, partial [Frankliniella fusca]
LSELFPPRTSSSHSYCNSSADTVPPRFLFQTTTVKVYARCLRPDIEYKTLGITFQTTCREVVEALLSKYRMRHRDPNLFFLTMEVTVRRAGVRTVLVLDEEARPAALQACHPTGDSRFALQTRRGGLVKIYDSALMPGSQYKSLLISERTTVDELLQILLNCYNSKERVEQFSLYEVNSTQEYQRKLHPDDYPLRVQQAWLPQHQLHFLVRRNTDYRLRRGKQSQWSPELASIPSSAPLSTRVVMPLSSTAPSTSSPFADYENYFYI